jgi:hypothetical protein
LIPITWCVVLNGSGLGGGIKGLINRGSKTSDGWVMMYSSGRKGRMEGKEEKEGRTCLPFLPLKSVN